MGVTRAGVCVGLLLTATACGDSDHALFVTLKTDFVPGVEFTGVTVELDERGPVESLAVPTRDYLAGERVAELDGLAQGSVGLTVRLLDPEGATVAIRELRVQIRNDTAVTALVSRTCRGVVCDGEQVCAGGVCADRECTPESPERCPAPECASDTDCRSSASCALPHCIDGACLYGGDSACANDEYCDPVFGCRFPDESEGCAAVLVGDPSAPSGMYTIATPADPAAEVFCEMELFGGGWTRFANVDAAVGCPTGWASENAEGIPVCTRNEANIAPSTFTPPLVGFREVMGYVSGLQRGSMDGFGGSGGSAPGGSLDEGYVEGVAITLDETPTRHVWTYVVSWSDSDNNEMSVCPCLGGTAPPEFIGSDYYCESGFPGTPGAGVWSTADPLWDGDGMSDDCGSPADPSRFLRTFPEIVSSPVVVRLMADQPGSNEDVGVTRMELFAR